MWDGSDSFLFLYTLLVSDTRELSVGSSNGVVTP